ncbi:MAG: TonB-dependent receptor [Candidatus Kapabacteria bacterium]|nr:TonB-dependent receptor [Ignavibacteriota bacterium]MCW5885502.1 TonB-dependent receptor [Candidatus Kapabacteria bacterium]
MSFRYNVFLTVAICCLLSVNVYSQKGTDSDSSATKRYQADEVTVMAPKDAMQVKLLPSSITLIEGIEIVNNNIRNLRDFSSIAPNFFMPDYGSKLTSPVYIRGIGSRINSPSVGLNVDYVPYFEKSAFDFDLFDIERIEILRGPQGTLYGRNTMGGIINVFTKSPLKHAGSEVSLNGGNFGFLNGSANHYGRLSNSFGYSLSMNYISEGGYFTNSFNDQQVDDMESISSRLRLIHQPNDYFSFENSTSFESSKQGAYPYSRLEISDPNSKVINIADIQDVNYNDRSTYDRDLFSNAFVFRINAPSFELISTSSLQFLKDKQAIDQDFDPEKIFFAVQEQDHTMLSQEIIVKSRYNPTYEWLFGGFGFYQTFESGLQVDMFPVNTVQNRINNNAIFGGAVFHQSTLNNFIIKNLSVIGGIRADYEQDELTHYNAMTVGTNKRQLADTVYPSLTSFQIMPKFALKYEINYFTHIYSSVSKGYKTGGFNSTFERPEDLTFDPEHSWNYEAGMKVSVLDGMLYADFAVFYIDWQDQQIYQLVPSGRGSMLKNAGKSTSQGVEFSMRATPVDDFDAQVSFGYTDARFETYEVSETLNYNGNRIPYVPLFTMSAQASKTFRFGGNGFFQGIRVNGLYRMTGEHYWTEANNISQATFGILDGTVSLMTEYFSLDFWCRNILDTDFTSFYFRTNQVNHPAVGVLWKGGDFVQRGKPQRFGIRLSARF